MQKNYETALPAGYAPAHVIDAKNKKTGVALNAAGGVVIVAATALAVFIIRPAGFMEHFSFVKYFIVIAALFAYFVLHELAHGAAYKLLTGQKLTFGLTAMAAFCGVPQIYVYRKTALISLLTPFTVFTLLFGGAALLLPDAWDKTYAAFLLACHWGGCAGDLYDTFLFLFRFRSPKTLMKDTGPKQTIYIKTEPPAAPEKNI